MDSNVFGDSIILEFFFMLFCSTEKAGSVVLAHLCQTDAYLFKSFFKNLSPGPGWPPEPVTGKRRENKKKIQEKTLYLRQLNYFP